MQYLHEVNGVRYPVDHLTHMVDEQNPNYVQLLAAYQVVVYTTDVPL